MEGSRKLRVVYSADARNQMPGVEKIMYGWQWHMAVFPHLLPLYQHASLCCSIILSNLSHLSRKQWRYEILTKLAMAEQLNSTRASLWEWNWLNVGTMCNIHPILLDSLCVLFPVSIPIMDDLLTYATATAKDDLCLLSAREQKIAWHCYSASKTYREEFRMDGGREKHFDVIYPSDLKTAKNSLQHLLHKRWPVYSCNIQKFTHETVLTSAYIYIIVC